MLFNRRRIDELLALMDDDVRWPDVAGGVVLVGTAAVRKYWEGQFARTRPLVEPTAFVAVDDDVVATVDQRILDLDGALLAGPVVVYHRYSFRAALISRMTVHRQRRDALGTH